MKNTLITIASLCFFSILCCSCKKDASPVNILVTTNSSVVEAGCYLLFDVTVFANENTVKSISVTSWDSERGNVHVWDTLVNSKRSQIAYSYLAPSFNQSDTTVVTLTFTATTTEDESTSFSMKVKVYGGKILVDYPGLVMYSAQSNNKNGFNIQTVQTLFVEFADSTTVDIYDYYEADLNSSPEILQCKWRSKTNISFVRYNDFNFPAATIRDLNTAYQAGMKYSMIDHVSEGDIILVGREKESLGVIQVVAIFDNAGTASDRYVFNFKKNQ